VEPLRDPYRPPSSAPASVHPYAPAWKDYQRRRRLYLFTAAVSVPVFLILGFTRPAPWAGAVAFGGLLVTLYLGERVSSFACPRCNGRFRRKSYLSWFPTACSRCNLPVGSLPVEAATADSDAADKLRA
jgi:hypothetical protein